MSKIKAGHAKIVDKLGTLTGSDHRMVYLDLIESAAIQGENEILCRRVIVSITA